MIMLVIGNNHLKLDNLIVKTIYLTFFFFLSSNHDHKGGNVDLVGKFKDGKLNVYGGDDRVGAVTNIVKDDDTFNVGDLVVKCIHTPCHTSAHICYYVQKSNSNLDGLVFTGDTLFQAGCGKFFEGTADQMHDALINKLSKLPDSTVSI
jgi:hydroxyacylglutathione hydrolase